MINSNVKFRTSLIFIFFCLCYAIIAFNLYIIQIQHATFYTELGTQQYYVTITQTPPRAPIYDRTGKNMLAMNKDSWAAFLLPKQITSLPTLQSFLRKNFPTALEVLRTKSDKHFLYIKRRLNPIQEQLIAKSNNADIHLLAEPQRYYPITAAAPLVGLTDIDNHGLFGIELLCNEQLAGKPTTVCLEKDARSGHFYFKKETKITGAMGTPVQLTIDSNLQFLSYQAVKDTVDRLHAQEGNAIVMDPKTGEILAMVTYPHFDPNNADKINMALTKNRPVTESYELGSVMKVFTALAALEEKVVYPDELIDCKDAKTAYIDGRKINTVIPAGIIPFTEVIAQSNNIGIAQVAKRLDTKLYDHYCRIGFGKKTGLNFPGEQKGFVNPPSNWSKQSIISLSYGYEISLTLLHLATAFCMIAQDGKKVVPQLLLTQKTDVREPEQLYHPETIATIKQILEHTTQHGTTQKARINGYRVMSKTGTANILVDGVYNPDKNMYTCAGIVEKGSYQRVIVVFIKQAAQKDLYASMVAAPLFETVAEHVLIHERII
jgi:cell division protein FtsI (penicillin-binding protein 3)